jgi:hypothetical protein
MHPLLQDLLYGVARAGVRAGVSALDSILNDVEEVIEEGSVRVKGARKKAQKIARGEPRVVKLEVIRKASK